MSERIRPEEHPFPYKDLNEYTAAMRSWILCEYTDESEEDVDRIMHMDDRMLWIRDGFKRKIPIDLVAPDVMYFCG